MFIQRSIFGRGSAKIGRQIWRKPAPRFNLEPRCRFINSSSHTKSTDGQLHLPKTTTRAYIPQSLIAPKRIEPSIYHQAWSTWGGPTHTSQGLERGSVLTVASWNLDWSSPDSPARTRAALDHLEQVFGNDAEHHVIMLQEISPPALRVILEHSWVQRNFHSC
jgi:hypothetical protein